MRIRWESVRAALPAACFACCHVAGYVAQQTPDFRIVTYGFRHNGGVSDTMQVLSSLGDTNLVEDINDGGFIVGGSNTPAAARAVLWGPGNNIVDLDAFLDATNPVEGAEWTLLEATGINNGGIIVGNGLYNGTPARVRFGRGRTHGAGTHRAGGHRLGGIGGAASSAQGRQLPARITVAGGTAGVRAPAGHHPVDSAN